MDGMDGMVSNQALSEIGCKMVCAESQPGSISPPTTKPPPASVIKVDHAGNKR